MLPFNSRPFHVLIPAAGSGERLGGSVPKQYQDFAGKPLLRYTAEKILGWTGLQSLGVIVSPEHEEYFKTAMEGLIPVPKFHGGATRKESIFKALQEISHIKDDEIILIHDAARPLIQWEDIQHLLAAFTNYRAATLAVPISDTLRNAPKTLKTFNTGNTHDLAGEIVNRSGLWAIQTPQAFYFGDIKAAHEKFAHDHSYTDDTSVASAAGLEIALVRGSRSNIKITTQDDLEMAEALMHHQKLQTSYKGSATQDTERPQTETRTGLGYDVHAFQDHSERTHHVAPDQSFEHSFTTHVPMRPLILCGVSVPYHKGLKGHSDADVGLHALTDALLGAIGEGDIGLHFPPSDNQFKDMASHIFVEKVVGMIADKGGIISNVDITIICEEPKITPHRAHMTEVVAEILGIDQDRVNIKATTTEKLGFTGRQEGIAAQAIATVILPV